MNDLSGCGDGRPRHTINIRDLPSETLIKIFAHVEFSKTSLLSIALGYRYFADVINLNKLATLKAIEEQQFSHVVMLLEPRQDPERLLCWAQNKAHIDQIVTGLIEKISTVMPHKTLCKELLETGCLMLLMLNQRLWWQSLYVTFHRLQEHKEQFYNFLPLSALVALRYLFVCTELYLETSYPSLLVTYGLLESPYQNTHPQDKDMLVAAIEATSIRGSLSGLWGLLQCFNNRTVDEATDTMLGTVEISRHSMKLGSSVFQTMGQVCSPGERQRTSTGLFLGFHLSAMTSERLTQEIWSETFRPEPSKRLALQNDLQSIRRSDCADIDISRVQSLQHVLSLPGQDVSYEDFQELCSGLRIIDVDLINDHSILRAPGYSKQQILVQTRLGMSMWDGIQKGETSYEEGLGDFAEQCVKISA